jgi:hypothetical protein
MAGSELVRGRLGRFADDFQAPNERPAKSVAAYKGLFAGPSSMTSMASALSLASAMAAASPQLQGRAELQDQGLMAYRTGRHLACTRWASCRPAVPSGAPAPPLVVELHRERAEGRQGQPGQYATPAAMR